MKKQLIVLSAAALAFTGSARADGGWGRGYDTAAEAQVDAVTGKVDPAFTVGETVDGYTPPGILDGTGVWRRWGSVLVLVNHELGNDVGYPYMLANGTELTGARVSSFLFEKSKRRILGAGLAYDAIYNRAGEPVDEASDLEGDGLGRLCSARGVARGERGFVSDVFLTGEETGNGTEWALDVRRGELWAAPELGRASWEAVAAVETGNPRTVGLIIGDDEEDAPLYYYEGMKNAKRDGSFLDRNGLAKGQLYCWAADDRGLLTPADFNGTGSHASGSWIPLEVRDPAKAGESGYDELGYLDGDTLRGSADDAGCFSFSRPEDVHENPHDPTKVVLASTGRAQLYGGADTWGTLYVIDVATGEVSILLDTDDPQFRDFGIRSPDNLVWSGNGKIYVQEDRSTQLSVPKSENGCEAAADAEACRDLAFGGRSKIDASIWAIDPSKPLKTALDLERIAVVNRDAVLPDSQTDTDPLDIGDWETSGILDVTDYFQTGKGETLLLGVVQAHAVRGGSLGDESALVEGGQIFFLELGGSRDDHGNKHDGWGRWDD
ncbi:MAG: alkaline phosphatase PhoX [Polyangiales bacterium]